MWCLTANDTGVGWPLGDPRKDLALLGHSEPGLGDPLPWPPRTLEGVLDDLGRVIPPGVPYTPQLPPQDALTASPPYPSSTRGYPSAPHNPSKVAQTPYSPTLTAPMGPCGAQSPSLGTPHFPIHPLGALCPLLPVLPLQGTCGGAEPPHPAVPHPCQAAQCAAAGRAGACPLHMHVCR